MINNGQTYTKNAWREMVLKRGWELEDVYWRLEKVLHRSMDIMGNVCPSSRYLTWWSISDKYQQYMKKCEILCTLICHSSALRADDFKLKSQLGTLKICDLCNNFELKDVRHYLTLSLLSEGKK